VFRSWKIKIILEQNQFASHTKIIDLGNDFRLTKDKELIANLLFGLPELNKAAIKTLNLLQIQVVLQQQLSIIAFGESRNTHN
jgi:hypothetical protein